ncbi:MAG: hypothetical protein VW397_05030 [Candidatus Margulisiibacteriota bacterium]
MQIDQINDGFSVSQFEHIDRIINAGRIHEMQELKKLVKFIDHLIQSLIHQIASGLLTDKGAKIKILQLFGIIQHCQIGNHPTIKNQLERLKRLFENNFKQSLNNAWLTFNPKPIVLAGSAIQHYVESIQDSQNDPIYSEKPNPMLTEAQAALNKLPKSNNNIALSEYYLSNLINKKSIYSKLKKYILKSQEVSNSKPIEPMPSKPKQQNRLNFSELSLAYQKNIAATA